MRFINDTQKFAILIYQLNKTKVKTESNIDENPRFDIFVGIVKQTRQVLCESETLLELVSNNTDLIQKLPPDLEKEKIWGNSTDTNLTKMCIRDRPVLSAFNTFMKKWKKILRTAFRLKGKRKNIKNNKHQKQNRKNLQRHKQVNVQKGNNNSNKIKRRQHKHTSDIKFSV